MQSIYFWRRIQIEFLQGQSTAAPHILAPLGSMNFFHLSHLPLYRSRTDRRDVSQVHAYLRYVHRTWTFGLKPDALSEKSTFKVAD